jgi:hypothetical protein
MEKQEVIQRVLKAHEAITRVKGSDYAPTAEEIEKEIKRQQFKEKVAEARAEWGDSVVSEVVQVVQLADPDGAYSTFEDMGMFAHSEVVEFLYFNQE